MKKLLFTIFAFVVCFNTSAQNITVTIIPPDSANHNFIYCTGTAYQFSSHTNTGPIYAYEWGISPTPDSCNCSIYMPDAIITFTNSGTYTVSLNCTTNWSGNSHGGTQIVINVTCATDIEQISTSGNELNIYPNPNNGSFVIEPQNTLYNVHCTVYDVTGKMVLSQILNGKTSIDASSLSEGVYNISLQSTEGVVNKRVVIVR